MKRVLILDGDSPFSLAVVRAFFGSEDWQVEAIINSRYSPVRFSKTCRRSHLFSRVQMADEQAPGDGLIALIRKIKPDVLLPVDVGGILFTARHMDVLRSFCKVAPTPTVEAVEIAKDKFTFATYASEHGIPHPVTVVVDPGSASIPYERLASLQYPVLTKPLNAGYGRGIRRFSSFIETRDYIQSCLPNGPRFLIQEEICGKDIDCSILCKDGNILAATVQRPVFANMREFASAAAIEFVQDDVVIEVASQVAKLLNWNGVAHIDMRYDERTGQIFVIEINPRFWGSLAGSTRSGVNFPVLSCQVTTGESLPSLSVRKIRYSSPQTLRKYILQTRPEGQEPLKFSETAFPDLIRDPFPAIAEIVHSIIRNCLSMISIVRALMVPPRLFFLNAPTLEKKRGEDL